MIDWVFYGEFLLKGNRTRKVVAQRAENNQKIYKKDNFYIISIEIVFYSLIQELYVPDSFNLNNESYLRVP